MLASTNEYINEAYKTIYQMSADEQIRKRCRDREEYDEDIRSYQRAIAQRDGILAEKDALIEQLLAENERLRKQQS